MENKENILAKWLNGEITDSELVESEGIEALEELKQVTQEMDQWTMPQYNKEAGFQRLKENIKEKTPTSRNTNWLKVIAVLCAIGVIAYGLVFLLGNGKEKLKAGQGENINYAFQDGSNVWINDGSSIEYNKSDWSTQRTIELQGEAQFEVTKGSPFTVQTPNGNITVLGTQFNVRAWGGNLYVECYEGKVQVQSGNEITILTAKEAVHIIDGSMTENLKINNPSPEWKNGVSRFYNDKFKVVCNELERQYAINVDLKANDRTFSGNFSHQDLDEALRSICRPLGLDYSISADKKTVVIE